MLIVSPSLVITLFAWFPGKEDEDKGLSCLQPRRTSTSDNHDSPRGLQLPQPGEFLLPSASTASTPKPSVATQEILGEVRQEGNDGKGQSTPYF